MRKGGREERRGRKGEREEEGGRGMEKEEGDGEGGGERKGGRREGRGRRKRRRPWPSLRKSARVAESPPVPQGPLDLSLRKGTQVGCELPVQLLPGPQPWQLLLRTAVPPPVWLP